MIEHMALLQAGLERIVSFDYSNDLEEHFRQKPECIELLVCDETFELLV